VRAIETVRAELVAQVAAASLGGQAERAAEAARLLALLDQACGSASDSPACESDAGLVDRPSERERRLAADWHSGQNSMLYAIASTGSLSLGTRRPPNTADDVWAESLLSSLVGELANVADAAWNEGQDGDATVASQWLRRLGVEYPPANSDQACGSASVKESADGTERFVAMCRKCHEPHSLWLDPTLVQRWESGELIQDVFPHLTPDQRELMISGICGACWDRMWPDDDEEDA